MSSIELPRAEKPMQQIDIEDMDEAMRFMTEHIAGGNFPIISVPVEYAEHALKGLEPQTSFVEQARIRAKIGEPFLPEGQVRRCFRIKKNPPTFRPERTGPDRHFHGVVTVIGPVRGEELEEVPCEMH